MFWLFAMAGRHLRGAPTDDVLREFERELADGAGDLWQVTAHRTGAKLRAIYKLAVRRLTGPRGFRAGFWLFEHEARYVPAGAATPIYTGDLTVSGDLDLVADVVPDSPHKLGLCNAIRVVKAQLQKRGIDVAPLRAAHDATVLAIKE